MSATELTFGVLTFCFLGDFSLDPKILAKNPLPSALVFSTLSYIVSLHPTARYGELTLTATFLASSFFSFGSSTTVLVPSATGTAVVSVSLVTSGSTAAVLSVVPSTLVAASASTWAVPDSAWVVVGCFSTYTSV
jgi:hypothetical protein